MEERHGPLFAAPGGDDYQNVWINPDNPDILITGAAGRRHYGERRPNVEHVYNNRQPSFIAWGRQCLSYRLCAASRKAVRFAFPVVGMMARLLFVIGMVGAEEPLWH
jgi:hypothetical protein